MESVSNAASSAVNTASKLIWGEQQAAQGNETAGQEPISGQQGKGTATDPYDQGNTDPTSTSSNPISTSRTETFSKPAMNANNAAAGGPPRPEHETEKTGVVGSMGGSTKGSDVIPSESSSNPGAAPESGAAPTHEQQGADRPSHAPSGAEESAVKEKKDDAEELLKKKHPNDHSGEPMKMHGGDSEVPKTQEERRSSKVGMPGGQEHGKEAKGTGEEWVKSSGLAAEGGDFDATKPGAGREADRLMEEKGIKKTDSKSAGSPAPHPSGEPSGDKQKVPLGDKIKAKLHIGHKDK